MRWTRNDGTIRKHAGSHHAHDARTGQPVYHDPNHGGTYGDGETGETDEACRRLQHEGRSYLWVRSGFKERWHSLTGGGIDHHGGLDHDHYDRS